MKQLIYLIIGKRAEGEPIQQPTLRTIYPSDTLSENEWTAYVGFGSRYGYKGSFYNKPEHVKVFGKSIPELA